MTLYYLYSEIGRVEPIGACTKSNSERVTCFLFDPANADYQTFKADVLAGAELQDVDGNVMTQEEAEAFIASLPE